MPWIKIAETAQVQEDEPLPVNAGSAQLAVFRYENAFHVTDNVCTHQYALLTDGYFEDGCIECPLHQGRFDIRTGKAMCAPVTQDIRVYPVRVEGGDILVEL